ncbi:hypothetical protein Z045_25625 [Rhodococcus pyridinivorans KG-16]|uniref:Uncharacterized protein n=1 Tax=Rhodococcus pyridinivorans KG-16 TaxID=1441730 RepID=A0A0V9UDM9_9NOCA|nr:MULTISPECIES: hypothetical protein [Rhodococcus]KSZ56011.1 hypothetical protein Z045_25625 [Rhodococcus pyridinivorans KG-16]MBS9376340.1 hypothetical protein [Rhodococcus sp. B50]
MTGTKQAVESAAEAMTDEELDTAIAALHAREHELLTAGHGEAASSLNDTKIVLQAILDRRHGRDQIS